MNIKHLTSILFLIFTYQLLQTKVICISIPKCGTYLLQKCIKLILKEDLVFQDPDITHLWNRSNNFWGHILYNNAIAEEILNRDIKGILIIRDPRDQAVSWINYIMHDSGANNAWKKLASMGFDKALLIWIQDTSYIYTNISSGWGVPIVKDFKGIDDFYFRYLPWRNHPNFYTCHFEKLVGPNGGGSDNEQFEEIKNIARHINVIISEKKIKEIQAIMFGGTLTFFNGQISAWKNHFKPEHKEAFKRVAGQSLIDLGYEKDLNW